METPRVTAVVCAYWPERFDNVELIVRDMLAGTVKPDTLIVLNNNPAYDLSNRFAEYYQQGVRVLQGWNTECRGKYVIGLLAFADYYLLNDDDITVGPRTLEYLTANAHRDIVTANRGIAMHNDSFFEGTIVDHDSIDIQQFVDSICGCSAFMSHSALVRTIALEEKIRHKWPTEGDDIIAGLANKGNVVVFPMKDDYAWRWLDTGGVAMNSAPDYYDMRDSFTRDVLAALEQDG